MQATVHLDTHHQVAPVDRRIFGGFLEHLGRAVYEGIYDPQNPLSDENGFRTDVLQALRPLQMPLIRYPGGNFVSGYDWRDGIGPRANRPTRPDYAWRSRETNQFGTDEFITWCRQLKTEPMMAINLGTLGTANAGEMVEYCNLSAGTLWADRRKANGHADPYGIKLWCLGNEMDGPWQAGHVPADEYARRAMQAAVMMKGLDPSIQTIACGSSYRAIPSYMHWERTVLEYAWDQIDFISAHRYSANDRQDSACFLAEGVEIDRVIEDCAAVIGYVKAVKRSNKNIHVCFDEWNVWYKDRNGDGQWAVAPPLLEELYNLEDALVCAQYLSSFIRHADTVKIACIAQIVNVIAPILTRREGLLLQATYYPFLLFSQHARGVSLRPAITSDTYPAGERGQVPAVDVSATYDSNAQQVSLFLINRDQDNPASVVVQIDDMTIDRVIGADVMGGGDVTACNTWDSPNQVKPTPTQAIMVNRGLRIHIPGQV